MKVYGHSISNLQIENAVEILKSKSEFTFNQTMHALEKCGVAERDGISYRAADRILQKMRKNDQIEFVNKVWVWL